MTFEQIQYMYPINSVDESKVSALIDSMRQHGFTGCPILVFNDQLLTGSHRLEALRRLTEEDTDVLSWDVAEDVTEIVNDHFQTFEDEHGWTPDLDYSDIGWMLSGSWVEEYKDEIDEW